MKNQLITPSVIRILACVSLLGMSQAQTEPQELREFVNSAGQGIRAKLVSHRKGKVMLARADGKEFEVDPVVFRVEDQAYIKEWMKSVPEKKQYRFTVNGTKTKVGGDFTDMGYKRIKNEQWAYKLAITNSSSDPVTGISIRYRLFYTNRADGEFSAGSDRGVYMKPGQAPIPGELVSNQTIEITTDAVKLDFVDYDGTRDRYKDELEGCIVQVLNADGQVLHEWSNTASPMKGRTWDNTGKLTQQISP